MNAIEGWRKTSLGDELELIRNGYSGEQVTHFTDFPVSRIETISEGTINFDKVGYADFIPDAYLLRPGDILLSNINSIKHIGKVAQVDQGIILFHGMNLLVLRPLEQVDKKFLFHKLVSAKPWFEKMAAQAINQASINQATVKQLQLELPQRKLEQAKIAEVLSTVDQAIEQTEALIAKQQHIKTGLMQDLLTRGIDEHGKLRSEETHQFKDSPLGRIPVEWEVKRLFELVDIAEGQKDPTKEPYRDWPLVAPDHVESGTGLLLSLITAREQRAISGKYEFAPGDIIYSKIRPYLRKAILVDFVGLCSADMYPMRPKGKTTSEFILLTILGERFSKYAESMSERSGFPKINRSELASFVVPTPLAAEQKRMASFSNEFAKSFELEKRLLTKLRSLKTALMQDLLTGKVRVTPLLDEVEVTDG